jgi:predicted nucleic acid-binding protein
MTTLYLDSSALAKAYIDEVGTERVIRLVAASEKRVISRLASVEITAACARREKAGLMSAEQLQQVLLALEEECKSTYEVVELGGAVMSRAAWVARTRALRAADAIQLACALVAAGDSQSDFVFVCADCELLEAARLERLTVLDPTV